MKCQKPNCTRESRVTVTSKRGHTLYLCAEHYFALNTPPPPAPVVISDITLAESFEDDDFDDAAGWSMSLGDA